MKNTLKVLFALIVIIIISVLVLLNQHDKQNKTSDPGGRDTVQEKRKVINKRQKNSQTK